MRIVLTGATGLVGGEVWRLLRAAGHDVVGVARRAPAGSSDLVAADCGDPDALARVLRRHDVLIHGAGISLGVAVAAALRLAPVPRVVAISSAAVTSRHRASAATYRGGEEALLATGRSTLLVRPTMIYGSQRDRNVHFALAFARRTRFIPLVGPGRARLQPIHYRDVAAAVAALACDETGGVVHAGGAAAITLDEAATEILEALGLPQRIVHIPYPVARASAWALESLLRRRVVERVDRMLEDRVVSNERLLELTRVRPRAFSVGIAEQIKETYG